MPLFFEDKRHRDGGNLDHEILSEYLAEYKSQPRAIKKNLTLPEFIELKEERRPSSNRRMKGSIFLLSTFDGSSSCTTKAWGRNSDAFFLLHPVVEKDVVEIAALHLQGEANIWWLSHLSHAKVTAYADFNHRLIKKFDKKKSEGKKPSLPSIAGALVSGGRPLAPLQDDIRRRKREKLCKE